MLIDNVPIQCTDLVTVHVDSPLACHPAIRHVQLILTLDIATLDEELRTFFNIIVDQTSPLTLFVEMHSYWNIVLILQDDTLVETCFVAREHMIQTVLTQDM